MLSAVDYSCFPHLAGATMLVGYDDGFDLLTSEHFVTGSFEDESGPFKADTIFEVDGPHHQAHRRLAAPLFNRRSITRYEDEVLPSAIDEAIAACATEDGAGLAIDLVELSRRVMAHVAAELIGLAAEPTALAQLLDYADRIGLAVDVKWASDDHGRVVADGHSAVRAFVDDFYAPALDRCAQLRDAVGSASHLLGRLTGDDGWDRDLRLRETLVYLTAGIRTTAHAITRTFEALERWYAANSDRPRRADGMFLRLAGNEALRLNPPSPALVRESLADHVFPSGLRVGPGQRAAVDLLAANTDVAVFGADADEFDPARALPDRVPGYGLSFGAGQHTCIGKPLITASGGAGPGPQLDRAVALVLGALYERGLRRDPDHAPRKAPTAQDRYESYPARLAAPVATGTLR